MPSNDKRAAIYARVSTKDQNASMQLQALREFAKHRGLVIVHEYVDLGISGTKDSRPQLNLLMDAARKRKLDTILVYRFDRFARSVRHLVNALHDFQGLGIEFISYSENVDTSTPLGRALFSIAAAMAQLERDLIAERSLEGVRRARERGKRIGRPRVEADEARIFSLKGDGKSLRQIAHEVKVSKDVVARVLACRGSPPAEAAPKPAA